MEASKYARYEEIDSVDTNSADIHGPRRFAAEEIGEFTVIGAIVDGEIS